MKSRPAQRIVQIYDRVQRQVYVFLAATLLAILLNGLSLIRWNRRLFARMAEISERRSELAQKLIATQESTLRYISRELHDEFGQILTAVGVDAAAAPARTRPKARRCGPICRKCCRSCRPRWRAFAAFRRRCIPSCSTRPDWRARSTGTSLPWKDKPELPYPMRSRANHSCVDGGAGVHVYRVLQEALNNVARHSGAKQAWVRLRFLPDALELEVEDHGVGFTEPPNKRGIGLVAMRERSELMGGQIVFSRPAEGGTLVHLASSQGESGVLWKRRSQYCWWMITAWCGAVSGACWKMNPTWRSSAKPATAKKPSSWRENFTPKSS